MPQESSSANYNWPYTVRSDTVFGPQYQGRFLINRDTPIRGGVYYGDYGGEAIVVAPESYPEEYEKWYDLAKSDASSMGVVREDRLLRSVFTTVAEQMPYSSKGVLNVLETAARSNGISEFEEGRKIELSAFMKLHVGECRHQALAQGALLEMFKDGNYIGGMTRVHRNLKTTPQKIRDDEGHAWVRHTKDINEPMILDVAGQYFGSLQDSVEDSGWNYFQPGEKQRRAASNIGPIVIGKDGRY